MEAKNKIITDLMIKQMMNIDDQCKKICMKLLRSGDSIIHLCYIGDTKSSNKILESLNQAIRYLEVNSVQIIVQVLNTFLPKPDPLIKGYLIKRNDAVEYGLIDANDVKQLPKLAFICSSWINKEGNCYNQPFGLMIDY